MDGIDFINHSCWELKTLKAKGGIWIECTGKNLPRAGDEPYYMVEIKDFKREFDTNPNCPLGTDVRSFSSQFKSSPNQSHIFFEINVGKRRIRHRTTLNLNEVIFNRF